MNRSTIAGLLLLTLLGVGSCNRTDATLAPDASTAEVSTPSAVPTPAAPAAAPNATTSPDAPDAPDADYAVIPGERVGQVTSTTSRQQLADLYGEANLQDTEVQMGEGFTEPGTVVSVDNAPQFTVVWLDASRSRPLLAKDFAPDWQTPEGIGVGMTYPALQQTLGEFQLYGFAWDYGGTLALEGSQLDRYYGLLLLRVEPSQAATEAHPDAFQATMGDSLFPSTDPNLAQLDIAVSEMLVYLNEPTE